MVLAKEAGLCYCAIALITDYDCWRESGTKVCVEEVMHNFKANIEKVIKLIAQSVTIIPKSDWDEVIDELQVFYFHLFSLLHWISLKDN